MPADPNAADSTDLAESPATSGLPARDDTADPEQPEQPEQPDGQAAPRPASRSTSRTYLEWLVVIVVAMASALLVRAFVVQQFAVDGQSMMTTLHNGDRVLVNKMSYRLHDPHRGDVVVLKTIEGVAERDLIKRVVGLEGETISYENCVLEVDGRTVSEPYLDPDVVGPSVCGPSFSSVRVLDDHVFVLGDNRAGSKDSRDSQVGQIEYHDLVGRAFVVIWPFGDWSWL